MKDREIIEGYLDSIKEELMMYKDSLSEKTLCYVDKLKNAYNCWEQDLYDIDDYHINKSMSHEKEKELSLIEQYLYNVIDEFNSFVEYKELYKENNEQDTLDMSHAELGHMLHNLSDMFSELCEYTKDNLDEQAMIKGSIKLIYQNFN